MVTEDQRHEREVELVTDLMTWLTLMAILLSFFLTQLFLILLRHLQQP